MFEIEWNLNKSVLRNLILIKGISRTTALKICALLGISPNTTYSSLSSHKVDQLNQKLSFFRKLTTPFYVKGNLAPIDPSRVNSVKTVLSYNINHSPILSNLDEFRKDNIKILVSINTLRGKRLKLGFPVRGQRTRSNAKTANRLNRA